MTAKKQTISVDDQDRYEHEGDYTGINNPVTVTDYVSSDAFRIALPKGESRLLTVMNVKFSGMDGKAQQKELKFLVNVEATDMDVSSWQLDPIFSGPFYECVTSKHKDQATADLKDVGYAPIPVAKECLRLKTNVGVKIR